MGMHIAIGVICFIVGSATGIVLMSAITVNGYDQKMRDAFEIGYEKGIETAKAKEETLV